jgi:hypothetical protein
MATVSLFVSDFSNIADWSVDAHNAAHAADLAWLNNEVDKISRHERQRQVLVLTHCSPTSAAVVRPTPRNTWRTRGACRARLSRICKERRVGRALL